MKGTGKPFSFGDLLSRLELDAERAIYAPMSGKWIPRIAYFTDYPECRLIEGISLRFEPAESPNIIEPGRFVLQVEHHPFQLYPGELDERVVELGASVVERHSMGKLSYHMLLHDMYRNGSTYINRFQTDWHALCLHALQQDSRRLDIIGGLEFDSIDRFVNNAQVLCHLFSGYYEQELNATVRQYDQTIGNLRELVRRDGIPPSSYLIVMKELESLLQVLLALVALRTQSMALRPGTVYHRCYVVVRNLMAELSVGPYMTAVSWRFVQDVPALVEWLRNVKPHNVYEVPPHVRGYWHTIPLVKALDGDLHRIVQFINYMVQFQPVFAGLIPATECPVSVYLDGGMEGGEVTAE